MKSDFRTISISRISVGERFRKEHGDIAALAKSIEAQGLLQPILVSPENRLICGQRRIMAFKQLGLKTIPAYVVAIARPRDAEFDENEIRKDFTVTERVAIADARREEEERAARKRMVKGGEKGKPSQGKGVESFHTLSKDRSEARMAKSVGMSQPTYRKAREVKQAAEADPDRFGGLAEEMDKTGRVAGVHRKLVVAKQSEGIESEPEPLPTGPFRVIVADPPWSYDSRSQDSSHRSANPYADMSVGDIKMLGVDSLSHDDAVLWLWTTNAHLPESFDVVRAWGFTYKTMLTWAKDKMGTGDWLRGKTEHCLLAVRGRPTIRLTNQTTLLTAPRGKHSEKPEKFYTMVESLCPGAKVELFARRKRKGWKAWGHES